MLNSLSLFLVLSTSLNRSTAAATTTTTSFFSHLNEQHSASRFRGAGATSSGGAFEFEAQIFVQCWSSAQWVLLSSSTKHDTVPRSAALGHIGQSSEEAFVTGKNFTIDSNIARMSESNARAIFHSPLQRQRRNTSIVPLIV